MPHHAPCAWFCSEKRQSLLFSTHLFAKGVSQIIVHCHPQRSTPRYARRYAASNDSPFYSTRFLRLGGRAPTRREGTVILRVTLRASRVASQLRMTVTATLRAF